MLSSSRARKIFLAQDLIENQARIVKSYVRTDDFDHWCYAASELVDLMIDLARRDEKYLQRDGLSTPEESHCRIARLNSQYVNSVSRLTFEIVFRRLYPKLPNSDRRRTRDSTSTTTTSPRTTPAPPKTTTQNPRGATPTGVAPPPRCNRAVPVGTATPPAPSPTSHERECWVTYLIEARLKEGKGKEEVRRERRGGKEERRG